MFDVREHWWLCSEGLLLWFQIVFPCFYFVSAITLWKKRRMRYLIDIHYLKIHHLTLLLESLMVSKLLTYLQLLIENIIKNWFMLSMHISCFECTCTQEGSTTWELAEISLRCSWKPLLNFFKSCMVHAQYAYIMFWMYMYTGRFQVMRASWKLLEVHLRAPLKLLRVSLKS